MTTIEKSNASIIWSENIQFPMTQGTPANALTTSEVDVDDDRTLWTEVIEAMLAWRSDPGMFEPEDQPDEDILDTAIDYACDQITSGGPAPSNVVPSGSGWIAFEWYDGDDAVIVELIEQGVATITQFVGNRVSYTDRLVRNPRTRKLELEG